MNSETDSHMIEKTGRVENIAPTSHAAVVDANDSLAVFGNTTTNICVYDVHTSQCVFDTSTGLLASEEISRLFFADQHCVLSCGQTSGTVTVWDVRAGLVAFELPRAVQTINSCSMNQSHTAWTCDRLSHCGPVSTLLLLESVGQVIIIDIRHGCQNHDVLSLSTGQTFSPASDEHMTIRASFCEKLFAISGKDSAVNIYALSSSSDQEVNPVFVHTGHRPVAGMAEPTVWTTSWHPDSVPNSLLSAASDGSLHAWQFIPGSY